ncbi:MAG: class I SAM-dependent methyltransferase [Candidatus Viridilinea halotolerans]|uniref:Class I SAM-dependent methyltransferase n=1 Tax=Candidatus Viridilinea halotolerans TaxID=2491704 RepID=A0A426TUE4_9CHLR|nr:MAG: class I SAM-dependent methyltransferase [Candidatus Viridilinea halotolerans]
MAELSLDLFHWLRSPVGQTLLAELAERPLAATQTLPELERLRRRFSPAQAAAALELALLRQRAAAKFPAAAKLFLTREALEQASAAPVAAQRAARLAPYGQVADLGCGIGGDTLALAAAGAHVCAVERDPLRLALCQANVAALGLEGRVTPLLRDLLTTPPPAANALFCDPGRRAGGRRRSNVEDYEPPLAHVLAWRSQTPALALKLAPGVDVSALPPDAEVEFVALNGELKEAALWCGPLATTRMRATLLHTREDGSIEHHTLAKDALDAPLAARIEPPAAFLYEPDPAIIRAGLVRELGALLGAAQLDAEIAYLTSPKRVATPFARVWPIIHWQPFNLKALRATLRELEAGVITVKKRGSPLDSDQLARQLSRPHGQPLVVVLTKHAGKPVVLICR